MPAWEGKFMSGQIYRIPYSNTSIGFTLPSAMQLSGQYPDGPRSQSFQAWDFCPAGLDPIRSDVPAPASLEPAETQALEHAALTLCRAAAYEDAASVERLSPASRSRPVG